MQHVRSRTFCHTWSSVHTIPFPFDYVVILTSDTDCVHTATTENDAKRSAFAFSIQNGLEVKGTVLLLHCFAFELVWTHENAVKWIRNLVLNFWIDHLEFGFVFPLQVTLLLGRCSIILIFEFMVHFWIVRNMLEKATYAFPKSIIKPVYSVEKQ